MDTIDTIRSANTALHPTAASRSLNAAFGVVYRHVLAWLEKRETRRTLRDLTEDQLRDIGLSHRDVKAEVSKSFFWD